MNRTSASKLRAKIENPFIDGRNVVYRVCKYGNMDEKVRKQKRWIENDPNLKIHDENTIL